MDRMSAPILQFQTVDRAFPLAGGRQRLVLQGVDFVLDRGTSLAMVGRSGSGKSTLLHLAAGIDRPTSGEVMLDGARLNDLADRDRSLRRRDLVGLVFQFFHLLPHLSVIENVCLPGWVAGDPAAATRDRAGELLARVELADRAPDPAGKLSGGEMQRVALCRALLRRPPLLLADEPTGNLDEKAGTAVMDLLLGLARDEGAGLLYVTHSREQAALADRVLRLRDGRLESDAT
jgi:predicted ABC-type transport system involved in lysophospholipase L1 biosynthesis ATPase subunit